MRIHATMRASCPQCHMHTDDPEGGFGPILDCLRASWVFNRLAAFVRPWAARWILAPERDVLLIDSGVGRAKGDRGVKETLRCDGKELGHIGQSIGPNNVSPAGGISLPEGLERCRHGLVPRGIVGAILEQRCAVGCAGHHVNRVCEFVEDHIQSAPW